MMTSVLTEPSFKFDLRREVGALGAVSRVSAATTVFVSTVGSVVADVDVAVGTLVDVAAAIEVETVAASEADVVDALGTFERQQYLEEFHGTVPSCEYRYLAYARLPATVLMSIPIERAYDACTAPYI